MRARAESRRNKTLQTEQERNEEIKKERSIETDRKRERERKGGKIEETKIEEVVREVEGTNG